MAASSGTWLKLPRQKWQFIPPTFRAQANRMNLTWDKAAEMTQLCCFEEPSEEALFGLLSYTSGVTLKSRIESGRFYEHVELTPRDATTTKVPSAIKLTGRRQVNANMDSPPGNFAQQTPQQPPGIFNKKPVPPPPPPPPGDFNEHQPTPPPPPGPVKQPEQQQQPASSWNTPRLPINHDGDFVPTNHGEEYEEQSKSKTGVNSYWQAHHIKEYLDTEEPGANVWCPWNSYIFDSITDFVSSIRAEASMPGAHFKWPEQRMTYEFMVAQAIHHLPPGYYVSIKNGNPCPKELLNQDNDPDWPGETTVYYHGTTAHNLLRGIIRDGLKPSFGAGADATATTWGVKTPMVYLSRSLECASNYPCHYPILSADKYDNQDVPPGGEIISRDGTPPIRVMLQCISLNTRQLWHKKAKANDQRGFMPKYVYISHIIFYALPPNFVASGQKYMSWNMYTATGHVATSDNLMMDESSSNEDWRNGEKKWLVPEVYGIGTMMEHPMDVNITQKDMLDTRMKHRQTAIIKKWIKVNRDPVTKKTLAQDNIPDQLRTLLDASKNQVWIPVLEHTKYSLKDRVESNYHIDDSIIAIMNNHQQWNYGPENELSTQEHKPEDDAKANKPTESSVDKPGEQNESGWKDWGGANSWSSQSWDGTNWSSKNRWNQKSDNTWVEKSDNKSKKQKTTPADKERKETEWRQRQAVAYTTHYRGILTVIMPFPAPYYGGMNQGSYVSPDQGQHCDPTTVYPIPSGDRAVIDKSAVFGGSIKSTTNQDVNMPDKWSAFQKQQEEDHRKLTKPALHDVRQEYLAQMHADWQDKHLKKNVKKAKPSDNDVENGAINHGDAADSVWNEVIVSIEHMSETKTKGTKKTVKAEGGLPLEVEEVPAPNQEPAGEDGGINQGCNPNTPTRKPVTREDKKVVNVNVNVKEEINMELPNVNDLSIQDKTKLIRELLADMINTQNSDTNMMLQLLTEAARMDAINRAASPPADDDAPPADHDAPPADDDEPPADADAPVADHDMGNAAGNTPPNNDNNGVAHEVSLDSDDDAISHGNSDGAEGNGCVF